MAVGDIPEDNAARVAAEMATPAVAVSGLVWTWPTRPLSSPWSDRTMGALGRIDVLHNNAADTRPEVLGADGDVASMTAELWDRTMAVNVRGPMLTCKHVIPPHAPEAGGGSIVNTSSASGLTGDEVRTAYAAVQGRPSTR